MALYQITMRIIAVRGKWSSSTGLPTFWVNAIDGREAEKIAKNVACGAGWDGTNVRTAGEAVECRIVDGKYTDPIPETYYGWTDKELTDAV